MEANDNYINLHQLEVHIQKLVDPTQDLISIQDLFYPIMHTISLIWQNSQFYKTPSRIVLLIRMICNGVILKS